MADHSILVFIIELHLIAAFSWVCYVVYNVIYHPKKAYNLLPKKFRSWSFLKKFGVTNRNSTFEEIDDRFNSLEEITNAMRVNGLEKANLIIGIDFTASNEWQGRKSFGGRSLHSISIEPKSNRINKWNPYQRVIRAIGESLQEFDEDQLIPVYGFGDERTKDHSVFSLLENSPCKGLDEVLSRYTRTVGSVALSGPTSFAPVIRKAIEVVEDSGKYHVLLIIADGRVEDKQDLETRAAIVEASNYPLSIVLVGVGDGPWETMHEYDDKLPQRRFDNFQFVEFIERKSRFSREVEAEFAVQALMEIPDQYRSIKSLGLLGQNSVDSDEDDQGTQKDKSNTQSDNSRSDQGTQEDESGTQRDDGSTQGDKDSTQKDNGSTDHGTLRDKSNTEQGVQRSRSVERRRKFRDSRNMNHVVRRRSLEGVLETDL